MPQPAGTSPTGMSPFPSAAMMDAIPSHYQEGNYGYEDDYADEDGYYQEQSKKKHQAQSRRHRRTAG